MGAEIAVFARSSRIAGSGCCRQPLRLGDRRSMRDVGELATSTSGVLLTIAAVPVRADHRGVRPRARAFPGRALVRREGQGLLDRLRPGDLRLQRPHGTRWRFAWIPLGGYVKFLDDENGASDALAGRARAHDAGGAGRRLPDQAAVAARGRRGRRADRQFPPGDRHFRRPFNADVRRAHDRARASTRWCRHAGRRAPASSPAT